jgi:RimJ/RimL family protein N-acetyltransferase
MYNFYMCKHPYVRDYITDGHISLRRYQIGDESALFKGINESIKELTQWGFYHAGFTQEDAVEDVVSRIRNWTEGESFTYLIEQLPGRVFIGNCKIEEFEPEMNHAALGWWVRTSMTNQGIATAASRLVARAAFEDLQLNSLSVYTRAENIASRRVAEKIGAVLLQIKPEEDGSYCAVYELKPEYLICI